MMPYSDVESHAADNRALPWLDGLIQTGALVVVLLVALGLTWMGLGTDRSPTAALLAFGICLGGSMAALSLGRLVADPTLITIRLYGAAAIRSGLPAFACLLVVSFANWLVDAGFIYYLLAFYVVGLIVDTVLATRQRNLLVTPR